MITVEDVNGITYPNHVKLEYIEIDTSKIGTNDFTNVKYDFVTVSRSTNSNHIEYIFKVENKNWRGAYIMLNPNREFASGGNYIPLTNSIIYTTTQTSIILVLLIQRVGSFNFREYNIMLLSSNVVDIYLNELGTTKIVYFYYFLNKQKVTGALPIDTIGLKEWRNISWNIVLKKTDFQFNCTQSLVVGKVNKVFLGTDSDYKPNGALVGSYAPVITVDYGGETLPVQYDSTNNDYYFNLDLTDKTSTGKVRFTVNVATNDVLNASSADVVLDSDYELINSVSKFNSFVKTGGVGRLGANIGLTADIAINKDVYIIGNDKSIDLTGHSIIVNSDKSFKAENTVFTGGTPCITQYTDSKVELTDCTVTGCTGIGSVIKCDIDLTSLDNPNDFTTVLNGCTFSDNTNMILHSGDLNVNNCTVDGAIGNSKYPYFLYQVDGTATLIANTFNIEKDSRITSDIGFNSCIFMVGETAIINGLSHSEWQDNGLTSFLESPQFNRSTVDLTYYYDLIMDYITMTASNGYCHAVSGEDFVFKANVTVRRD